MYSLKTLGTVVLLTLGEDDNQSRRAQESGLAAIVDTFEVTQTDKGTCMRNIVPEGELKVVLFDDSEKRLDSAKQAFPDALAIHCVFDSEKETKSDVHLRATSYNEAPKLIKDFVQR